MNVSVAAAILLILKLKDNEDFKLPILGIELKKKRKHKIMKTNYLFLITVSTSLLSDK
jgi:hypothetical protein